MEVSFKIIEHASQEWADAVALREEILRIPLGSRFTEDELNEEKNHFHIIGQTEGKIIATSVLVPEALAIKMQRVVVLKELRNFNIGSRMMEYCETFSQQKGYKTIYCHARDTAVNFYHKNGYQKEGDYFDEDGIPHLKMRKSFL